MNSTYRGFGDAVRSISGQNKVITGSAFLTDFAGSLEAGVLLSQIIYWSDRTSDPDGWFYKSYDDWFGELKIKKKSVMGIISKLESAGIIETTVRNDPRGITKKHYRIITDRFDKTLYDFKNSDISLTKLLESDKEVPERTSRSSDTSHELPEASHEVPKSTSHNIQRILTKNTYRDYEQERAHDRNVSPTQNSHFCDGEIIEDDAPKNLAYPLTIHTPIVARSENKTVPTAARGKKAIETEQLALVCATWNEQKGGLWASIRIPPTEARSKAILKFVKSCGPIETAIEYLEGALQHMRNDPYWAAAKGLAIENVLSNGKVQQNYEKYLDLKENPAIAEIAETLKEMQAPKSFGERLIESNRKASAQALANRMKSHPEEFENSAEELLQC